MCICISSPTQLGVRDKQPHAFPALGGVKGDSITPYNSVQSSSPSALLHVNPLHPQVRPPTLFFGFPSIYLDVQCANKNVLKKTHT